MIELSDVSVIYPSGQVALHDCSLTFLRGQFTVLLGSSGAGKSTLLHCLNLLLRPTRGTVRSEDLGALQDRHLVRTHRRRTGMVFQQHHLLSRYSALQNVLMARLGYHYVWRTIFPLSEQERRFALECLDRVGLLHKALERVENLSGGERQRVGIARALAQAPRLILADEPVASLDPATAHKILGLLHRVCREDGITAVVSLHQVDLARTYADRVVGLNQGRVVFDGPPDRLLTEAQSSLYSPLPVEPGNGISGNGPAPSPVPPLVRGSDS
jgi:phosphonate transport system ATP-binding protein